MHLIIRTGIGVYRILLQSMQKKFPTKSILSINSENYLEYDRKLKTRPMFSSHYFVEFTILEDSNKLLLYTKTLLQCKHLKVVFLTNDTEIFDKYRTLLAEYNLQSFNSYEAPDNMMCRYIKSELLANGLPLEKATPDVLYKIRQRAKYQDYILDRILPSLANTACSKEDIERLIPKYQGISSKNIGISFFIPEKRASVFRYIEKHRYSVDHIFKSILEINEEWLLLYDEFISGKLTRSTMLNWLHCSGAEHSIRQVYQVERWLSLLENTSFESMIYINAFLYEHQKDSDFSKRLSLYTLLRSGICG